MRQITDLRASQTNQRRLVTEAGVLGDIDELVALLNRQIRALEAKIAQSIDADPLWKATLDNPDSRSPDLSPQGRRKGGERRHQGRGD